MKFNSLFVWELTVIVFLVFKIISFFREPAETNLAETVWTFILYGNARLAIYLRKQNEL